MLRGSCLQAWLLTLSSPSEQALRLALSTWLQVLSFALALAHMLPQMSLSRLQLPPSLIEALQHRTCSSALRHGCVHTKCMSAECSLRGAHTSGGCGRHAVDFGSGSGNLTLPLAWLLPDLKLTAVDSNAYSVARLKQRAADAGLRNVSAFEGRIEEYRCVPYMHIARFHASEHHTCFAPALAAICHALNCTASCRLAGGRKLAQPNSCKPVVGSVLSLVVCVQAAIQCGVGVACLRQCHRLCAVASTGGACCFHCKPMLCRQAQVCSAWAS